MAVCPACGARYPVRAGFCPMDGSPLGPDDSLQVTPRALAAVERKRPLVVDPPSSLDVDWTGSLLDGRYRIETRIGAGGMGVVYEATHVHIGRKVAVKILRREHVDSADLLARFEQEARLACRVHHPNVVEIMDFGRMPTGELYYVMERLEGRPLSERIDGAGPLPLPVALDIAWQVSLGLAAAHQHGIVHRDLKPDNVFLCAAAGDGRPLGPSGVHVKILDFGIARAVGRRTRITKVGAMVGTPEYMSPEQARGEDADPRADLYALGVILFEMLTGDVPFRADTVMGTLTRQMFDVPPRLAERCPTLSSAPLTERLVRSLLAKARGDRPGAAQEVSELLRAALEQEAMAPVAQPAPVTPEPPAPAARTRLAGSGGMAVSGAGPGKPAAWNPDVVLAATDGVAQGAGASTRAGTPSSFLSAAEHGTMDPDGGDDLRLAPGRARRLGGWALAVLVAGAGVWAATTLSDLRQGEEPGDGASRGDGATPAQSSLEPRDAKPPASEVDPGKRSLEAQIPVAGPEVEAGGGGGSEGGGGAPEAESSPEPPGKHGENKSGRRASQRTKRGSASSWPRGSARPGKESPTRGKTGAKPKPVRPKRPSSTGSPGKPEHRRPSPPKTPADDSPVTIPQDLRDPFD